MTSVRRWFARIVLTGVLPIVCLGLFAWIMHGPAWGWAAVALGFMLLIIAQSRRLAVLAAWIDYPDHSEFPDSGGVWGEVFLKLSRKLRLDARTIDEVEARLKVICRCHGRRSRRPGDL
jgi:hypothetical protein